MNKKYTQRLMANWTNVQLMEAYFDDNKSPRVGNKGGGPSLRAQMEWHNNWRGTLDKWVMSLPVK